MRLLGRLESSSGRGRGDQKGDTLPAHGTEKQVSRSMCPGGSGEDGKYPPDRGTPKGPEGKGEEGGGKT